MEESRTIAELDHLIAKCSNWEDKVGGGEDVYSSADFLTTVRQDLMDICSCLSRPDLAASHFTQKRVDRLSTFVDTFCDEKTTTSFVFFETPGSAYLNELRTASRLVSTKGAAFTEPMRRYLADLPYLLFRAAVRVARLQSSGGLTKYGLTQF